MLWLLTDSILALQGGSRCLYYCYNLRGSVWFSKDSNDAPGWGVSIMYSKYSCRRKGSLSYKILLLYSSKVTEGKNKDDLCLCLQLKSRRQTENECMQRRLGSHFAFS